MPLLGITEFSIYYIINNCIRRMLVFIRLFLDDGLCSMYRVLIKFIYRNKRFNNNNSCGMFLSIFSNTVGFL